MKEPLWLATIYTLMFVILMVLAVVLVVHLGPGSVDNVHP